MLLLFFFDNCIPKVESPKSPLRHLSLGSCLFSGPSASGGAEGEVSRWALSSLPSPFSCFTPEDLGGGGQLRAEVFSSECARETSLCTFSHSWNCFFPSQSKITPTSYKSFRVSGKQRLQTEVFVKDKSFWKSWISVRLWRKQMAFSDGKAEILFNEIIHVKHE